MGAFASVAVAPVGVAAVNYGLVTVGHPGNAADSTGYGGVAYEFRIGMYDVTISQYAAFLNAVAASDTYGLYDAYMSTNLNIAGIARSGSSGAYAYSVMNNSGDSSNRPITRVSWFDAARFANWLANGQPVGGQTIATTENGAYSLNGITTGSAVGRNVTNPNTGAAVTFYIPTEDEWYKAAYFSPNLNAGAGGYYAYATQSNVAPGNTIGNLANQANYYIGVYPNGSYATGGGSVLASKNYLTNVGAFTSSSSFYGTFDQSGSVYQWNDLDGAPGATRGLRGGAWNPASSGDLVSSRRLDVSPDSVGSLGGFRLASPVAVPFARTISVAGGSRTQGDVGYALLTGTLPLIKTGAGELVLNVANTMTGSATVQAGTLRLDNPSALGFSRLVPLAGGTITLTGGMQAAIGGLAADAGGKFDVGSGKVAVASGLTPSSMLAAILAGRGDGSWNGARGISSSVAATRSFDRAIGWLDIGDGSVAFAYSAQGDTNLDWQVDILDAANFLAGGKFDAGIPAAWSEGDFGYDGVVDILDAADFLSAGLFDAGIYNAPETGSIAPVPEPSIGGWSCVGLAFGAWVLGQRRIDVADSTGH
jgi:autotransporter-associated beta strand protein